MSKKLSRSWFVAIIIVAGFALASCGGGTSTSQKKALADSEADLAASEAKRATQQKALAAAESAKQKALDAAEIAKTKLAMAIESAFQFALSVYGGAISEYNDEASEYDEKHVVDYNAETDDSDVDKLLRH